MLFVCLLLCDSYRCSKLILIHNRLPLGHERGFSSTSQGPTPVRPDGALTCIIT